MFAMHIHYLVFLSSEISLSSACCAVIGALERFSSLHNFSVFTVAYGTAAKSLLPCGYNAESETVLLHLSLYVDLVFFFIIIMHGFSWLSASFVAKVFAFAKCQAVA